MPIRDVDSYSEAEGLFEEFSQGGPPTGIGSNGMSSSASAGAMEAGLDAPRGRQVLGFEDDLNLIDEMENVPRGGLALAFLVAGGLSISTSWMSIGEPIFIIGVGLLLAGFVIIGWAGILRRTQGWEDAIQFLTTTSGTRHNSSDSKSGTETTPPAPKSLKNKLIFERANQRCEWCGDRTDHPEVHHIESRSEGGPNDESNLIVLCPTCHRKADSGGISKTKLKGKLRHKLAN